MEHNLNVTVSDGVFSARTRLTVTLDPVNIHSPTFTKSEYRATVVENEPAGTFVIKVAAQDPDKGSYGRVSYRLLGDSAAAAFTIDGKTGL